MPAKTDGHAPATTKSGAPAAPVAPLEQPRKLRRTVPLQGHAAVLDLALGRAAIPLPEMAERRIVVTE